MSVQKKLAVMVMCIFMGGQAFASELVHTPVNPSFVGGNAFNGAYLLNSAAMQNDHKEKAAALTPLEQFDESLQRSLLYAVTSKLTKDMYGEDGFKPGHYSYAGMDVDVTGGVDSFTITIIDTVNGGTTTVTVPNF
ncbi:curli assembly protein CsgF [Geomonas anaerohicana]|uniref:Curli production assembly/transport component CsgF n=1 Tax=Geomonas anaerohicana TaxID=2798583 RepID=A0ABS0YDB5_9BACT|nr:curli assembly protein CsgF [Geomonas anaerohicana]MBJ6749914.1 hypothetical protein [Geomonas anaerohicana]